jgi:hypothetical protein
MTSTNGLALVAAWFVFGMARIVFTSMLAEHRIDNPDPGKALANNRKSRAERLNEANYNPRGRRLLPWYRVINTTYWALAGGGLCWALIQS